MVGCPAGTCQQLPGAVLLSVGGYGETAVTAAGEEVTWELLMLAPDIDTNGTWSARLLVDPSPRNPATMV